jgi:hypothetical protein
MLLIHGRLAVVVADGAEDEFDLVGQGCNERESIIDCLLTA